MIIIKKTANSLAFLDILFCKLWQKESSWTNEDKGYYYMFITSLRLNQIGFDTPDIIKAYKQAISKSFSTILCWSRYFGEFNEKTENSEKNLLTDRGLAFQYFSELENLNLIIRSYAVTFKHLKQKPPLNTQKRPLWVIFSSCHNQIWKTKLFS